MHVPCTNYNNLIFKKSTHFYASKVENQSNAFQTVFLCVSKRISKLFFGGEGLFPTYGESIALMHKIIFNLAIAIINECFEFQNDWLKIIRIRFNCKRFCPIPLCLRN